MSGEPSLVSLTKLTDNYALDAYADAGIPPPREAKMAKYEGKF